MPLRDTLCDHIAKASDLRDLAHRLQPSHGEDLIQHLALIVCEMQQDKLERIEPYFHFWCVRTLQICAKSRGAIGKYCDTPLSDATDTPENPDEHTLDPINAIQDMYWFDRDLLLLYSELGSTRRVAEQLNIPRQTLDREITRIKKDAATLIHR